MVMRVYDLPGSGTDREGIPIETGNGRLSLCFSVRYPARKPNITVLPRLRANCCAEVIASEWSRAPSVPCPARKEMLKGTEKREKTALHTRAGLPTIKTAVCARAGLPLADDLSDTPTVTPLFRRKQWDLQGSGSKETKKNSQQARGRPRKTNLRLPQV